MTTMITVDGVMHGLGGPEEDRRGGFERGGRSGRQPIWTVLNTKPRTSSVNGKVTVPVGSRSRSLERPMVRLG